MPKVKQAVGPDGHFKFPHLWPVKFLQAGQANYQSFEVSRAMRAAASLLTFRRSLDEFGVNFA